MPPRALGNEADLGRPEEIAGITGSGPGKVASTLV